MLASHIYKKIDIYKKEGYKITDIKIGSTKSSFISIDPSGHKREHTYTLNGISLKSLGKDDSHDKVEKAVNSLKKAISGSPKKDDKKKKKTVKEDVQLDENRDHDYVLQSLADKDINAHISLHRVVVDPSDHAAAKKHLHKIGYGHYTVMSKDKHGVIKEELGYEELFEGMVPHYPDDWTKEQKDAHWKEHLKKSTNKYIQAIKDSDALAAELKKKREKELYGEATDPHKVISDKLNDIESRNKTDSSTTRKHKITPAASKLNPTPSTQTRSITDSEAKRLRLLGHKVELAEETIKEEEMLDEQLIIELSKKTLASYVSKAATDVHNKGFQAGEEWGKGAQKNLGLIGKKLSDSVGRQLGIKKAVAKLAKEEFDLELDEQTLDDLSFIVMAEAVTIVQGRRYGGSLQGDDDDDEDDKPLVKKGRGRPSKASEPTSKMHGKGLKGSDFGKKWGGYAESVEITKVGNIFEGKLVFEDSQHTFTALTESGVYSVIDQFLELNAPKQVDNAKVIDAIKSTINK